MTMILILGLRLMEGPYSYRAEGRSICLEVLACHHHWSKKETQSHPHSDLDARRGPPHFGHG